LFYNKFLFLFKFFYCFEVFLLHTGLMGIEFRLNVILAEKGRRLKDLAQALGMTMANASHLKTGKVKALKLATLAELCAFLECEPADLLKYHPEVPVEEEKPVWDMQSVALPDDFLD